MKYELTAKRLKMALEEAGLSQQELADKSGVTKASISQYINGSHTPSNLSSGKMGKILKVNPLWLMGFDAEMRKDISYGKADKDIELLEKISMLNERDRNIVLNLINSMLSNKERGEY